jgi:superfamily II DNA or RNA helicase
MKIVTIAYNAITAKLVDADREAKLLAQAILSYKMDGFDHMSAFKGSGWDGRANFLDFTAGTFPRGFVSLVQIKLKANGYKVKLVHSPLPAPLGPEHPVVDKFGDSPRYDYQPQVMDKLVRHGQIIAQVATGGGKSRIAKLCTERINRPTLFLTTRGVLMYQMAENFKSLGKNVAILGDGNLQISKQITCGMVQTIASWLDEVTEESEVKRELENMMNRESRELSELTQALKKEKASNLTIKNRLDALRKEQESNRPSDKDLADKIRAKVTKQKVRREKMIEALATFEFVILEEAHEASGNSFYEIMRHCKNAHYRLALTATPFMKDSEEANMRLMASSGPVAIQVSEKTLIDREILAKPYFKFVTLKSKPDRLFRTTPWQRAYKAGIVENDLRNKHVVVEAYRAVKYGLSVMVLVQHKDHGRTLKSKFDAIGIRSDFIFGEDDQTSRTACLNQLKTGELNVLIGSTILDVGVDVPAVGMVILAGGGKAEVALRQRIGRGLREKLSGLPNVCFIVDFADVFNGHLNTHYLQRRAIIESTPGFAENIVNDFDYAGCGLMKRAA